jgi:hypothetical protein
MPFHQLVLVSQLPPYDAGHLEFVAEWDAKRKALIVMIGELPELVVAHKGRVLGPHPNSPEITVYNAVPSIHLANACETVSHLVYSMAEVAARFGNKVFQEFPATFNALRKKIRKGELGTEVTNALGDLQWYEKMREIRTEWAHYSSPFIGEKDGEPSLVLRSFRSVDNRQQFTGHVSFSVDDLSGWARSALETIDKFAELLLRRHVLPKFDLDREIVQMVYDETGFPIIRNGIPQSETMTVREFMRRYKIIE